MLVFRDNGDRTDRQKARLIWLIERIGNEEFVRLVGEQMGGAEFGPEVHPHYGDSWKRRDVLGVNAQKQEGRSWVRCCRCCAACGCMRWVTPIGAACLHSFLMTRAVLGRCALRSACTHVHRAQTHACWRSPPLRQQHDCARPRRTPPRTQHTTAPPHAAQP